MRTLPREEAIEFDRPTLLSVPPAASNASDTVEPSPRGNLPSATLRSKAQGARRKEQGAGSGERGAGSGGDRTTFAHNNSPVRDFYLSIPAIILPSGAHATLSNGYAASSRISRGGSAWSEAQLKKR